MACLVFIPHSKQTVRINLKLKPNKARHGDVYYIAASPTFRSRACSFCEYCKSLYSKPRLFFGGITGLHVGHRAVFLDAKSGEPLGDWLPWQGTAADLFVQAQFPLHSGWILGLPGRILISVMGVVVAMLSITGVVIWYKRYSARRSRRRLAMVL
ncbi:PepSY domain-containing protein [Spongiibacter tropicus]|uniref:PepSY domain-containing protein n=1 Tax=Spongiibacter tropicus TaxID=454602 RepID=UPI003A99892B